MSADLEQLMGELEQLDIDGLRLIWKERYGAPPTLRSEPIMRMLLSWRIQAEALGGLDDKSRKALARSGPVEAEGKHLGIGATLRRNWRGREVVVAVEEDGFRWGDRLFPSLSAAATAIAGSRWNGPRFFGLRSS
ncbi:DUF2924 domain-containing protein [Pseudoblastomonas halimionae]|uniref:DUF2924 domain-containing protein n=1 Tax=Alteriqipengyuania halimionae TaxID=1926630 RepID=A0A6I4U093_9SPHN|nr:DUF2924 domain-containing protein [Alteriqipengyuania halimionae]MXP08634.1 DUF2924 domain-containing protein [Alteriqipengyuania halimionae]